MLNKGKALQHGSLSVDYSDANSLLHKLLHACSVIAVGRPHLFYFRRCLKAANRLRSNKAILTAPALQELTWWESQLEKSDEHGLPFASRFDFPTWSSSESAATSIVVFVFFPLISVVTTVPRGLSC